MNIEQNNQLYDVTSSFRITKLGHYISHSDEVAHLIVSDVISIIEHDNKEAPTRRWALYVDYMYIKPYYTFIEGNSWVQDKTTRGTRMSIIQEARKNDESENPVHWVDCQIKSLYTFTTHSSETYDVIKKWTKEPT